VAVAADLTPVKQPGKAQAHQARRQDFAAWAENHKGRIQYWMYAATGGPNMKLGAQILNGGRALLAPCWRRR